MSANTKLASPRISSAPAGAHSGSALDRAAGLLKRLKARDLVINALWVAFAAYGLAATVNVILTY